MQSLYIQTGKLTGLVNVPPSKSYANRALILSAISRTPTTLKNIPKASDVTNLINSLSQIGLAISRQDDQCILINSFPECELPNPPVIEVGEGGTTARFLAGMLLLGSSRYSLVLGGRLKERPWKEFIELASSLGGFASLKDNVLTVQGPAKFPAKLNIDCSKTTQFATAIQLLKNRTHCEVVPQNISSSHSYFEMTEKMVLDFDQKSSYEIPLDWSSASYPMAFAALNQKIKFPGLKKDSYQADSKFITILETFGAVEIDPDGLTIKPIAKHESIQFDVSDCLDLVPTLAYFLSHIEGSHELQGVSNLIHKESDRLKEVIDLIIRFGREAKTDGKVLWIIGKKERLTSEVDLAMPDDHRMVMAGSLFLRHHGGGTISPAQAVEKSYPDFFKLISC